MTSTSQLTGSHLRTYQTIFQHPVSHNLAWRAVHGLLEKLGHLAEEPNGNLKVTRNGHLLVLHPPRTKDVADTDELMALRHFLERSEVAPPNPNVAEVIWLLVIDHHQARIYRTVAPGAVPQVIRSQFAEDVSRHVHPSRDLVRGAERLDPKSFFEPAAGVLNGTGRILIFGSGTGTSSAMDQFAAWLKAYRPELAKRIIGTVVVDEHHLTEAQILAKAREFHANLAAPSGAAAQATR